MKKLILLLLPFIIVGCSSAPSSTSDESSSIISSSSKVTPREGMIELYAVNDYHGRISNDASQKNNGIARVAGFLDKEKEKHPNEYVFLNAGDLWQDTYESENSKGKCLIESMAEMNCEAMAIGNHEFDWGIDVIKENKSFGDSKNFNLLGANVYNFDNLLGEATTHADEICDEYKIITRNNLKLGIIGIIGTEQITSITSSIWENLTFVEPLDVVRRLSDKLRNEDKCDGIILLAHSNISSLGNSFTNEVTKVSPNSNKKYIDCCFTGHSHTIENELINGVPFVQSSYKGEYVSHVSLSLKDENECLEHEHLFVSGDQINEKVSQIVDKYIDSEFIEKKNEKVVDITNLNSFSTVNSGRLQAYATYEELKEKYDVKVVLNNGGRDTINISKTHCLTNETLFNSCPFFNKTIVTSLSGQQINYLIKTKSCKYFTILESKLVDSEQYLVAVIDYVLLHKNASRGYDYVSGYDGSYTFILDKTPFEIIKHFVSKTKTIDKEFFNQNGFSILK